MDFNRAPQLLGFASHSNQAANDTVSFQNVSRFRNSSSHLVSGVPLQLMERQTTPETKNMDTNAGSMDLNQESKIGGEVDGEVFRILGHSMCLKRRRDRNINTDSASSHMLSKRCHAKQNRQGQSLEPRRQVVRAWGNQSLQAADPDIFEILKKEKQRQHKGIELIASKNFVCKAVMEALGSHVSNKYSEGIHGARYYAGNQYIDEATGFSVIS
ncbi:hypothetical protein L1987_60290 [Smallanthus sonchifolius]|uniref:Uncharacterized protein n=1 Tax=Smallanthus sonchifolius TaxID=185202 RepID=A0ACB9D8H5_9ASTR|nr:hypothetical protein L1987_60290 [Smallanthus sonchifolius]